MLRRVDLTDIVTAAPIDKTAALVTSQTSKESEFVAVCRELDNAQRAFEKLIIKFSEAKNKQERGRLNKKRFFIESRIRHLKERKKALNIAHRTSVQDLIIRECIARFSKSEWDEITSIAKQKHRSSECLYPTEVA